MSLTIQPDNRGESGPMQLPSEDDEDSSMLADLVAMFPSLDHEVIVSVLQAHDGCIQAAVEYLMSSSSQSAEGDGQPTDTGYSALGMGYFEPACDMVGQFSDDIGGLPELLPRCLYEDEPPDEDERGEVEVRGHGGVAEERSNSDPPSGYPDVEDDPLPSYEEACRETFLSQSQSSLHTNLVEPRDETEPLAAAGLKHSPRHSELVSGQHRHAPSAGLDELMSGHHSAPLNTKKKKGKKLYKIASKLNPRKKSISRNGVMQEKTGSNGSGSSQQYQPLIDADELQEED